MADTITTNAQACDAVRQELAEMRTELETRLVAAREHVTYVVGYDIKVNSSISQPNQTTMTVSLSYQFTQS